MRGNELEFRVLMQQQSSSLYHYALLIVKLKESAEEIVSDQRES